MLILTKTGDEIKQNTSGNREKKKERENKTLGNSALSCEESSSVTEPAETKLSSAKRTLTLPSDVPMTKAHTDRCSKTGSFSCPGLQEALRQWPSLGISAGEKAAGPLTELGKFLELDLCIHLFWPLIEEADFEK